MALLKMGFLGGRHPKGGNSGSQNYGGATRVLKSRDFPDLILLVGPRHAK